MEEGAMKALRNVLIGCAIGGLLVSSVAMSTSAAERHRPRTTSESLVGTWILDVNTDDTQDPPALLTVEAGGTLRLTDCCNGVGAGVWQRPRSDVGDATATLLLPWYDEDGFVGWNTIRAFVRLSADGDSIAADYTMDIPNRDGTTSGQLGPVHASGTRMITEAPGEPIGQVPAPEPETTPTPTPTAPPSPVPVPSPQPTD
jgi:hypothetical protein